MLARCSQGGELPQEEVWTFQPAATQEEAEVSSENLRGLFGLFGWMPDRHDIAPGAQKGFAGVRPSMGLAYLRRLGWLIRGQWM